MRVESGTVVSGGRGLVECRLRHPWLPGRLCTCRRVYRMDRADDIQPDTDVDTIAHLAAPA